MPPRSPLLPLPFWPLIHLPLHTLSCFTGLEQYWHSCCSSNIPEKHQSPGPCTVCSFCLKHYSLRYLHGLLHHIFQSWPKCHFLSWAIGIILFKAVLPPTIRITTIFLCCLLIRHKICPYILLTTLVTWLLACCSMAVFLFMTEGYKFIGAIYQFSLAPVLLMVL